MTHAVIHFNEENEFIHASHSGSLNECERYINEIKECCGGDIPEHATIVTHMDADARSVARDIDEGAFTLDWYLNGIKNGKGIVPMDRDCAIYGYDRDEYERTIRSYLGHKYNLTA